ncbi:MAG: hypothetical protein ACTSQA_00230 [Candidatus Heimdallarchaeaceae archaeon]
MEIIELAGTADGSGDLTLTATNKSFGYVEKIVMDYIDGDTGADSVWTNVDGAATTAIMTKADLGTADVTWLPRSLANKTTDGSAFTNVAERIFVTGNMKVVISNGASGKKFRFLVTITDQ